MGSSSLKESTSLILVTLILLSLVLFGVLSVASANADYRLAVKSAEKTAEFYRCEALAEEFYASAIEANHVAGIRAEVTVLSSSASMSSLFNFLGRADIGFAQKRVMLHLYFFGEEMSARFADTQFADDLTKILDGDQKLTTDIMCTLPSITDEKYDQKIKVTLRIQPNEPKPVEIIEWAQWQEAFEPEFGMPILIFG